MAFLELFVDAPVAADERTDDHAVAPGCPWPASGVDQALSCLKVSLEVVVGAEIKQLTTCNFDLRTLRRRLNDDPFVLHSPAALISESSCSRCSLIFPHISVMLIV